MNHWAAEYIALPWRRGATGPDAYDCFGLVTTVLRKHYGIDLALPALDEYATISMDSVRALLERHERQWRVVAQPQDGDVVVMCRRAVPAHVGIVVRDDTLRCLHSLQPDNAAKHGTFGVTAQRLMELPFCGWGRLVYYRHESR